MNSEYECRFPFHFIKHSDFELNHNYDWPKRMNVHSIKNKSVKLDHFFSLHFLLVCVLWCFGHCIWYIITYSRIQNLKSIKIYFVICVDSKLLPFDWKNIVNLCIEFNLYFFFPYYVYIQIFANQISKNHERNFLIRYCSIENW